MKWEINEILIRVWTKDDINHSKSGNVLFENFSKGEKIIRFWKLKLSHRHGNEWYGSVVLIILLGYLLFYSCIALNNIVFLVF